MSSAKKPKRDGNYFKCYESVDIHSDLLRDRVRTSAYRLAIFKNFKDVRNKVVLDVGAGSGILSLFCAQAGAKRVYAIEASTMAEKAKSLVAENSYDDVISVIQSKVEDVELTEKVDVIVSEWMGIALLVENMLPSVLFARDNFLKEGGLILPDIAHMYLAPITHSSLDNFEKSWDDLAHAYELKLDSFIKEAKNSLTNTIQVNCVEVEEILSNAYKIISIDLNKIKPSELENLTSSFEFKCYGHNSFDGFVLWFDVHFPENICLSTSPFVNSTHWQHTLLLLNKSYTVEQDTQLKGKIKLSNIGLNSRDILIDLEYSSKEIMVKHQSFVSCIES